jgi:hypothetical protein
MSRSILALVAGFALAMSLVSSALCEELVGTVVDQNGNAVPGATVVAHTPEGLQTGTAIANPQGQYQINGLAPGQYYITLNPATNGFEGQTVASYVGNGGLTVNWSVAPGVNPVASATPGAQLSSFNPSPISDRDYDKYRPDCHKKTHRRPCDRCDCRRHSYCPPYLRYKCCRFSKFPFPFEFD